MPIGGESWDGGLVVTAVVGVVAQLELSAPSVQLVTLRHISMLSSLGGVILEPFRHLVMDGARR